MMSAHSNRRDFLARAAAGLAATGAIALSGGATFAAENQAQKPANKSEVKNPHGSATGPAFRISLAEWSLHKTLQKNEMTNLDFPQASREKFGIEGLEFVNQFFMDKAEDHDYLTQLKTRCDDHGVKPLLIMIDREGALGDPDSAKRTKSVENHYKWVSAAKFLGCHSIRVNAQSSGGFVETLPMAADGLRKLCEFADQHDINVIVENHGGLSSNGAWLSAVMELVDHPRVGTLPDFGNFAIDRGKNINYDRYKGVNQLVPYAKAISAKSYDFDAQGNETTIDYARMMGIVTGWGYNGFVGIEYEGSRLSEAEGILATKALLERVRSLLSHA